MIRPYSHARSQAQAWGYKEIVKNALEEDIGTGDVTTEFVVPPDHQAKAIVISKESGVVAGLEVAKMAFSLVDGEIDFNSIVQDGDEVDPGQTLARISGRADGILSAERVSLNFLQRLSGIATATRHLVKLVEGHKAKIADTRKTTPGLRMLEKYAVRVGGGYSHRFGLYDAVLIKDNHIKVSGGVAEAVRLAKGEVSPLMKIEVETKNLEEVAEALSAGVDIIMLDNTDSEAMSQAVKMIDGAALVEASGNITTETIREVAATGVDFISVGALTHSFKSLDISLKID